MGVSCVFASCQPTRDHSCFTGSRLSRSPKHRIDHPQKLQESRNVVELNLSRSKITDAGLLHLKGLPNLQTLSLPKQITDAGLVHLRGLTNLQVLDVKNTQATDAGIAELQKALPNCKISK